MGRANQFTRRESAGPPAGHNAGLKKHLLAVWAICICGWEGPVRGWRDERAAQRDAEKHFREVSA